MTMRDKCEEAMARAIRPEVWGILDLFQGNSAKLNDYHNAELHMSMAQASAAFNAMINTLMEPDEAMLEAANIADRGMLPWAAQWKAMLTTAKGEGR